MTARTKFRHALLTYSQANAFPTMSPRVAIVGRDDYDALFLEASTSVVDFLSCEQSNVSLDFQRQGVAHFYYNGVLVIRSPGIESGFTFA